MQQNTTRYLNSSAVVSAIQLKLYVVYSKLYGGKLLKGKSKKHNMSEKRHKINKVTNYQNQEPLWLLSNIIVRNNPTFDRHDFVPSQNR